MSILIQAAARLRAFASKFGHATRHQHVLSMSNAELSARGFDRENLVRGFITGVAHR